MSTSASSTRSTARILLFQRVQAPLEPRRCLRAQEGQDPGYRRRPRLSLHDLRAEQCLQELPGYQVRHELTVSGTGKRPLILRIVLLLPQGLLRRASTNFRGHRPRRLVDHRWKRARNARRRDSVGDAQKSSKSDASKPIPSLLSRLATGSSDGKGPAVPSEREQPHRERGQGRRNNGEVERERNASEPIVPAKRRVETPKPTGQASTSGPPQSRQSRPSPDPDKDPIGGYSIRGAAKAAKRSPPVDNEGPSAGSPASLLQRLQPVRWLLPQVSPSITLSELMPRIVEVPVWCCNALIHPEISVD
ncbi:hypothetical protein GY45DRAFT_99865 [Cubamyces sp. BRFM 1775]|nr:hypothetical protein GY45DRAFT_99865 [Cubamyces sp. BRFM 1775]